MANLTMVLSRLGALFGRAEEPVVTVGVRASRVAAGATNDREHDSQATDGPMGEMYAPDRMNRRVAIAEYETLCDTVPEFGRAWEILCSHVAAGDYTSDTPMQIQFSPAMGEDAQAILLDLAKRLKMYSEQRVWVGAASKKGDLFRHQIFDGNGVLLRLDRMRPEWTTIRQTTYGRVRGYEYEGYAYNQRDLAAWEVAHWAYGADDDSRPYGRSLFAAGGREIGPAIRALRGALLTDTLTHSGGAQLFEVPFPSGLPASERDAHKRLLEDQLRRKSVLDENGNLNRRVLSKLSQQDRVVMIPYDAETGRKLGEFKAWGMPVSSMKPEVLREFGRAACIVTGVPADMMGLDEAGDGIGGNRLEVKHLVYLMQCNAAQFELAAFNLGICESQLIALGYPIVEGGIIIVEPDLRAMDDKIRAEVQWLRAQCAEKLLDKGFPFAYVWTEVLWDGDVKQAEEKAEYYGIDLKAQPVATNTGVMDSPEMREAMGEILSSIVNLRAAFRLREGARATSKGA